MKAAPPNSAPVVNSLFGVPLAGPPLVKPIEVARALGMDVTTVYGMCDAGELETFRRPKMAKSHIRITRRSFIARLALMSSHPLPELPAVMLSLASTLSPGQRTKLIAGLEAIR